MNAGARSDTGSALIAVLLAVVLIGALAAALVLGATAETAIAANFQRSSEVDYAVEAIAQAVVPELQAVRDWTAVLNGSTQSRFVDGAGHGSRTLADGSTIVLEEIVNLANCDKTSACTDAEMDAVTADRPWSVNNPRWQLYVYTPLDAVLPAGAASSPYYVVLMVGDDPAENDGDPTVDGGAPATGEADNPGFGRLMLRAEAFGPAGAHSRLDLTIGRSVRVLTWRPGAP
jgi:hypothetical protein